MHRGRDRIGYQAVTSICSSPDTCHPIPHILASCRHSTVKYWCQCVNIWSINTCAITNYTSIAHHRTARRTLLGERDGSIAVGVCGRINKATANGSALHTAEKSGKRAVARGRRQEGRESGFAPKQFTCNFRISSFPFSFFLRNGWLLLKDFLFLLWSKIHSILVCSLS